MSALGDEYNKLTGFDEGANDYMIKPFNVEELKARAKSLLSRHASKQITEVPKQENKESPAKPLSIDVDTNDSIQSIHDALPKGSNILVVGPTGTGKSSFCRNFINQGLTHDETCLMIALDDDPKKFVKPYLQNYPTPFKILKNKTKLLL